MAREREFSPQTTHIDKINSRIDKINTSSHCSLVTTHSAPTSCPVCQQPLAIVRLGCEGCGTAIEGRFSMGRLGRLSREQLDFVEVFLHARGKIKDVEAALGISYPTVVSRLEQVVAALGAPSSRAPSAKDEATVDDTDEVLDALARGAISADEAAARIRTRKKRAR